jgi:hypothetical protein
MVFGGGVTGEDFKLYEGYSPCACGFADVASLMWLNLDSCGGMLWLTE